MNRSLMSGAALAAVLLASPALAQQPDAGLCNLEASRDAMAPSRAALDVDGDGRITLEEYQRCLDANVPASDRQSHIDAFNRLDADGDRVVVVADITGGTETRTAAGARPAEVAVAEQPADVNVRQPAPTVRVEQQQPEVRVEQPEPQVAVEQRQPEVRVEQRQPEVSVTQPQPTVSVEQPEAEVSVRQQQPQVSMDVPPPEVEVHQAQPRVRVDQRKPEVSVEQPEPEVRVQQAQPNVEVQQEEPRIVVEQAEPEIEIQRVTAADAGTTRQSAGTQEPSREGNAAAAGAARTDETVAMNTAAGGATTPAVAPTARLSLDDIEGETAYNNADDDIGRIKDVVMEEASGRLFVVVSAGGFLGIGNTEIVFPYEAVSMRDNRVHIATNISKDQLEERDDYDQSRFVAVPEDRVVR
jgi:hypothetical protein